MAQELVTLSNGERVAKGVYTAFLRLQAACKNATGSTLWISSGFRTAQDQIDVFLKRYRQQATGNGPYNDVRWWQGRRYVRISPDGTVAVPGTSMHEKASAVDFGGIPKNGNSALARWLRANAANYGFSPTGYSFGEAWHYDYTGNPWAGSNATPFEPPREENDMGTLDDTEANYQVFAKMLQRALRYDVRPSGLGPSGSFGSTLWERLSQVQSTAGASGVTEAQVKAIADAVIAQIKVPAPEVDYAKIAKSVNDDAATRRQTWK